MTKYLMMLPLVVLLGSCEAMTAMLATPEGAEAVREAARGTDMVISGNYLSGGYLMLKGALALAGLWLTGKGGKAVYRSVQNSEPGKVFGPLRVPEGS